tara:strand:- start:230 stop:1165 length:936 start_codon:yes stop_codon:yes gene_type:complete
MQICQRRTSSTGIGNGNSGYWVQDRWQFYESGAPNAVVTQSQSTTTPDGFYSSLKFLTTTNSGTVAAADLIYLAQIFEGQDLQGWNKGDAQAKSVTLSFWVNATQTGTYVVRFLDADNSRAISKSYTIDSADTWEYKTLTYAGDTTGAFGNDANSSLYVQWGLVAGTDWTSGTLATSWASGSNATSFEPCDAFDADSDTFHITGVQLELGDTATAFEYRRQTESLFECQRYYEQLTGSGGGGGILGTYGNGGVSYATWTFKNTKRAAPTMTQPGSGLDTIQNTSTEMSNGYKAAGSYAFWGWGATASAELS